MNHFEICVSFRGVHLFATHQRSLTEKASAYYLLTVFREKFPKEDGYEVTMTYWETKGDLLEV